MRKLPNAVPNTPAAHPLTQWSLPITLSLEQWHCVQNETASSCSTPGVSPKQGTPRHLLLYFGLPLLIGLSTLQECRLLRMYENIF